MTYFILNENTISTDACSGAVVLDFIRDQAGLKGTKEGCREGDCGACTIMVGGLIDDVVRYRAINSCLLPLGDVNGKHVVTIEGINTSGMNLIQRAFVEEGATQCGFCTPGFIMSLTAYFLSTNALEYKDAIRAVDGNICRCTGYASIKRAISKVCEELNAIDHSDIFEAVMSHRIIPGYFHDIPQRLKMINENIDSETGETSQSHVMKSHVLVAGGTDLYVQRPDDLLDADIRLLKHREGLNRIWQDDRYCYIGAAATIEEIRESGILKKQISRIDDYLLLFASTPIRNQATLGGNLINASPIGDTTIFFLALDAWICLSNGDEKRELRLKDFYLGYKKMDKGPEEILEYLKFPLRGPSERFNYEKVSKRIWLDIASVNSAINIRVEDDVILDAHLSAGGVSPVPLFLSKTSDWLKGRKIDDETVTSACAIADSEISPISDVRGSEKYKRLLLKQLLITHFKVLFPDKK